MSQPAVGLDMGCDQPGLGWSQLGFNPLWHLSANS